MTKPTNQPRGGGEGRIILDLCGGTGSWSRPYAEAGYTVHNITLPEFDVLRTVVNHNPDGDHLWFLPPNPREVRGEQPKLDVPVGDVCGILSAPPCTQFSFARTNAKVPRDLEGGMEIVEVCLKIIRTCLYRLDRDQQKYAPLKFWALENPYFGMLRWFLGKPAFVFDPWEFGDAYKKRTALWGHFNEPERTHSKIEEVLTRERIGKHETNSQKLPTLGRDDEMVKFDYMKSKDIHPEVYGKFDRQTRRAITPKGFAEAFFKANQ